jgi:hypothetical protein
VQSIKNQLNSKSDKTKFFSKSSLFDIKRKSQFICMTYNLSNKSFHWFYRKTFFLSGIEKRNI